jgi:DNA-binding protein HU-beta
MNKQELATRVAESTGLGRNDTARAIDAMLDIITESLAKGEEVRLVGFGNFVAARRKPATIVNPRTREPMDIGETVTPKFRVGRNLKAACNGGLPG